MQILPVLYKGAEDPWIFISWGEGPATSSPEIVTTNLLDFHGLSLEEIYQIGR
jgi:hypothetical protein